MNTKGYFFHHCSFLIIQNGNLFSYTITGVAQEKKAFTYQNVHWVIQSSHLVTQLMFGILFFIWQPYWLPNSLLLFIEVSSASITTAAIPVFLPISLFVRPYSSHACTITITPRLFSSLNLSPLHITASIDFYLATS